LLTNQAIKRDEGKARSEGRSAVESRPAKVGCFLQISSGPLTEEQPSIAGLVPVPEQCVCFGRIGFWRRSATRTRGVARQQFHRMGGDNNGIHRARALSRGVTTVALFA
jgi:hypothetical protein